LNHFKLPKSANTIDKDYDYPIFKFSPEYERLADTQHNYQTCLAKYENPVDNFYKSAKQP